MENSREKLALKYFGGSADTGEMNYYEAAGSIMAFGDLMGLVAKRGFGGEAVIETNVVGLRDNCFAIEFLINIVGPSVAILQMAGQITPRDVWETAKQLLELFRFLEGSPPKTIRQDADGIQVENNRGQITQINNHVHQTIIAPGIGEAVEGILGRPLETGHSRAALENKATGESLTFDESEAEFFKAVFSQDVLAEQVIEITLVINTVSFKDGNKWRFNDGQSVFWADIQDQQFLKRVDQGEGFSKGDLLRAKVLYRQVKRNAGLHMEHSVLKVLSHERPGEQEQFISD